MKRILPFSLTFLLFLAGDAAAVRTAYWTVSGVESVREGTTEEITIGPLGAIELAPRFEPVGGLSEYYVWSVVADDKGNLYVGTGDQGKIYRIDRKGEATLLHDSIELDILTLALDREGNLYAGTSPDGVILRIDRDGRTETFLDTPEHYVWDLVVDERGDLYAATGEQGKVYRVSPSGEARVIYESGETNLLRILRDRGRDRFILGGAGNGLLLEMNREGIARVLFEAPREEIGALAIEPDGTIWAAASGGDAGNRSKNGGGENALLFRVEPGGPAVMVWRSEAEFIYALEPDGEGGVIVGTGTPGAVVRVGPDGAATEWKRTAESQLLGLVRTDGGVFACTGNQGAVYRIGPERSAEGSYESEIFDAVNLARWGSLTWWGDAPEKTEVRFFTRSGNREEPDDTWSDWERIDGEGCFGAVQSPPARFLQWKAELEGREDRSPRIDRVSVAWKETNQPPRVLRVDVTRLGDTYFQGPIDPRPEPLHQVLSNGTRVEYMPVEAEDPPAGAEEIWARSIRVVRWETADPNGDELAFDLHLRAEGDENWVLLDEDLYLNYYSWDTRLVEDGVYRVRVTARDDPDNSEATARSAERIGQPFQVDNTNPEILRLEARLENGRIRVSAEAWDGAGPIRNAHVSVNAGEWKMVDPEDEIFDSPSESFLFLTDPAEEGETALAFRVIDMAGNETVRKAMVR
ncbi:MAG: hypothetical protein JW958_05200 [Candidatus Eisenbacteria bacterium]|nr:hypothetical protein [Candidatus Eisenbacteria bacterium]